AAPRFAARGARAGESPAPPGWFMPPDLSTRCRARRNLRVGKGADAAGRSARATKSRAVEFVGAIFAHVLAGLQERALGGVEIAEEVFDIAAGEALRPADAALDAVGNLAREARGFGVVRLAQDVFQD